MVRGAGATQVTEDQNKMMVQQYLYEGASIAVLADRWNMSYQGMAQKLKSGTIKEMIDAISDRVENESKRAATYVRLNLMDYVQRIDGIARNDDHPQQFTALKYQIDKVWPTVVETHAVSDNAISTDVLDRGFTLMERFADMAEKRRGNVMDSPHILRGEAALPTPQTLSIEAESSS